MSQSLYETDFFSWTQRQAELLRAGHTDRADLANIAEEIETLGRSEESKLESAYMLIGMHLLKVLFQSERTTPSWRRTILHNRLAVAKLLRLNPGLKPKRERLFASAYEDARKEAAEETGMALATFPAAPPFTLEQIEDEEYKPGRLTDPAQPKATPRRRGRHTRD